jgi:hypothetical protein
LTKTWWRNVPLFEETLEGEGSPPVRGNPEGGKCPPIGSNTIEEGNAILFLESLEEDRRSPIFEKALEEDGSFPI